MQLIPVGSVLVGRLQNHRLNTDRTLETQRGLPRRRVHDRELGIPQEVSGSSETVQHPNDKKPVSSRCARKHTVLTWIPRRWWS